MKSLPHNNMNIYHLKSTSKYNQNAYKHLVENINKNFLKKL